MVSHPDAPQPRHGGHSYRIFLLLVALSLTACNTKDELVKQHAESVQRETDMLRKLEAYLDQQAKTPSIDTMSVFVSASLINSLFKGIEGVRVPLADAKGAVLQLDSIKADFRTGFPQLKVDATVTRGKLRVAVAMAARVDAFVDSAKPDRLSLKVHVDSLVPVISWNFLQFRLGGLVRDLLQAKVGDALNKPGALGDISVPLSSEVVFNLPAGSRAQNVTGAVVAVSTPGMIFRASAQVTNIIYLSDGIHVIGRVQAL